jgi:hypothetical protein
MKMICHRLDWLAVAQAAHWSKSVLGEVSPGEAWGRMIEVWKLASAELPKMGGNVAEKEGTDPLTGRDQRCP